MSPGQSAETRLTLGESSPGLILPNDSFINDTGGAWVFVRLARRQLRPSAATIRLGRRNNRQVEIAAGLEAGERVIVSNYGAFGKVERLQIAK